MPEAQSGPAIATIRTEAKLAQPPADVAAALNSLAAELRTADWQQRTPTTFTFTQHMRWERPYSLGWIEPVGEISVARAAGGSTVTVAIPVEVEKLPVADASAILEHWQAWIESSTAQFVERLQAQLDQRSVT